MWATFSESCNFEDKIEASTASVYSHRHMQLSPKVAHIWLNPAIIMKQNPFIFFASHDNGGCEKIEIPVIVSIFFRIFQNLPPPKTALRTLWVRVDFEIYEKISAKSLEF